MEMSPDGFDLLKASEGCRLHAYDDATGQDVPVGGHCVGTLSIGYGDTIDVVPGQTITQEEADERLAKRLPFYEAAVSHLVTVDLTQGRYDALTDFCYNLGQGALGGSTLLKYVNRQEWEAASAEFPKWCHGPSGIMPGLVKRRARERNLFDGKPWQDIP